MACVHALKISLGALDVGGCCVGVLISDVVKILKIRCNSRLPLKLHERTFEGQRHDTAFRCETHMYLPATYGSICTGAIFLVGEMNGLCYPIS